MARSRQRHSGAVLAQRRRSRQLREGPLAYPRTGMGGLQPGCSWYRRHWDLARDLPGAGRSRRHSLRQPRTIGIGQSARGPGELRRTPQQHTPENGCNGFGSRLFTANWRPLSAGVIGAGDARGSWRSLDWRAEGIAASRSDALLGGRDAGRRSGGRRCA